MKFHDRKYSGGGTQSSGTEVKTSVVRSITLTWYDITVTAPWHFVRDPCHNHITARPTPHTYVLLSESKGYSFSTNTFIIYLCYIVFPHLKEYKTIAPFTWMTRIFCRQFLTKNGCYTIHEGVMSSSNLNPLTAGAKYIGCFTQLLPHSVPPFKHVKAIMWHQSSRFEKSWPPFCQI